MKSRIGGALLFVACALPASAQVFNSGIPTGYSCAGNCSTAVTPNGDVAASPTGSTRVGYVTAHQTGNPANPLGMAGSTNGSQLYSSPFTGTAGQTLSFWFDFITTDGAGYPDIAYVQLLALSGTTTLFTARTNPTGNTVPGMGMPPVAPGVVTTPATVMVTPNATLFSGLFSESGLCFAVGCGSTGWVGVTYELPTTESYRIMFGVNNFNDGGYSSALAFDYAAGVGGVPYADMPSDIAPEPSSIVLVATAMLGVISASRTRRKPKN